MQMYILSFNLKEQLLLLLQNVCVTWPEWSRNTIQIKYSGSNCTLGLYIVLNSSEMFLSLFLPLSPLNFLLPPCRYHGSKSYDSRHLVNILSQV